MNASPSSVLFQLGWQQLPLFSVPLGFLQRVKASSLMARVFKRDDDDGDDDDGGSYEDE